MCEHKFLQEGVGSESVERFCRQATGRPFTRFRVHGIQLAICQWTKFVWFIALVFLSEMWLKQSVCRKLTYYQIRVKRVKPVPYIRNDFTFNYSYRSSLWLAAWYESIIYFFTFDNSIFNLSKHEGSGFMIIHLLQ